MTVLSRRKTQKKRGKKLGLLAKVWPKNHSAKEGLKKEVGRHLDCRRKKFFL